MKGDVRNNPPRAAIAVVRECADTMDACAADFLRELPKLALDDDLRAAAVERCADFRDASGRVTFELALLQSQLGEGEADLDTAVKRLSAMDATLMGAVAAMTDIVDRLESAAERDARLEPVFVRLIEAMGMLLQGLDKAKAATQALQDGTETAGQEA